MRAGPPLLRLLERLLVLLHLVSGCSHGCSRLLPLRQLDALALRVVAARLELLVP